MEKLVVSDFKLGILGGGQLGKMLALAAGHWGVRTFILDTDEDMPAAPVAYDFTAGDFRDFDSVYRFGKKVNLLTVEIEQVNLEALERLEREGVPVLPGSAVLKVIQDKATQNEFLAKHGIPKPEFSVFENRQAIEEAVTAGRLGFPFVQKLRRGGYDGRGVKVIRSREDMTDLFDGSTLVEAAVEIEKEISVIVARNRRGETAVYPAVEMVINPQANLVDYLACPAALPAGAAARADVLARRIAQALNLTGILAVEMFLDKRGEVWVNELAPRPHNSGHQTIESCVTSQYEQHLRAIMNFPLGSTAVKMPSVMVNLLGEPGFQGVARYTGLTECLAIEGVKLHIYGKRETRPFRKMGHVTILDSNPERALEKARRVRNTIKVIA